MSERKRENKETVNRRSDIRKAKLQQAAEAAGFNSWSEMLTAIIKGKAKVIVSRETIE